MACANLGHLAGHVDVVFVAGDALAVGLQRAIHHHRREAGADRGDADGRALAVILVHDDGNVRVGFEGGQDLVAQEGLAGVFAGAGRGLHDDRGVDLIGRFHDGPAPVPCC